jgi:hypothetical protein
VETEAIAAIFLRPIEREVGLHQEGFRIGNGLGKSRDPDARRDVHPVGADRIGRGKGFADLVRQHAGSCELGDIHLQHGKLVAAETRDEVGPPDDLLDAFRDVAQQLIADRVALGIVHVLEMVEIEIEHGKRFAAAPRLGEDRRQSLEKGPPVGKPGKRVDPRQFGDLAVCQHEAVGVAGRSAHVGHRTGADQ